MRIADPTIHSNPGETDPIRFASMHEEKRLAFDAIPCGDARSRHIFVNELSNKLEEHDVVFAVIPPGCGKTVAVSLFFFFIFRPRSLEICCNVVNNRP